MPPLRLAVVGHTNTGKTSLLQTLLRRRDFGEVRPSPGTTRTVEAGEVVDDDGVIAILLDTPGFEEPDRLRDAIESARIDRYGRSAHVARPLPRLAGGRGRR
ncbi:MAG: GTPase domain-containing protein [Acidobacteriota bacterium]|nr:GTPase domain-containing protein [Acidobacteriota bacterium]